MSDINTPEWIYEKQRLIEDGELDDLDLPSCYASPDSIDAWRHRRMSESIAPLLEFYRDGEFLTIGDGNFGSDANFLGNYSANVLASSLDTRKLVLAKERGYVSNFKEENAEKIDQKDNSFDIVYCKEAYHHFPRPPIAFYEMLRVSRQATVLIEPNESKPKALDVLKQKLKKIIRRDEAYASTLFEPGGNYIYRTNPRDIEKYLISLNFRYFAYKQMNDFYHPSVSSSNIGARIPYLLTISMIKVQDILCKLGVMNYGLICIVAFKSNSPSEKVLSGLRVNGFNIEQLPINPYL